jgi:hypothetical protein
VPKAHRPDEYTTDVWGTNPCPKCGRHEFSVPSAYKRIVPRSYYPFWEWDGPMRFRCSPTYRVIRGGTKGHGCGYEGPNYEFVRRTRAP